MKISSAELIVYLNDEEDNFSLSLSPTQLQGIVKLLGIEVESGGDGIRMYSDKSLQLLLDKTLNNYQKI